MVRTPKSPPDPRSSWREDTAGRASVVFGSARNYTYFRLSEQQNQAQTVNFVSNRFVIDHRGAPLKTIWSPGLVEAEEVRASPSIWPPHLGVWLMVVRAASIRNGPRSVAATGYFSHTWTSKRDVENSRVIPSFTSPGRLTPAIVAVRSTAPGGRLPFCQSGAGSRFTSRAFSDGRRIGRKKAKNRDHC